MQWKIPCPQLLFFFFTFCFLLHCASDSYVLACVFVPGFSCSAVLTSSSRPPLQWKKNSLSAELLLFVAVSSLVTSAKAWGSVIKSTTKHTWMTHMHARSTESIRCLRGSKYSDSRPSVSNIIIFSSSQLLFCWAALRLEHSFMNGTSQGTGCK